MFRTTLRVGLQDVSCARHHKKAVILRAHRAAASRVEQVLSPVILSGFVTSPYALSYIFDAS